MCVTPQTPTRKPLSPSLLLWIQRDSPSGCERSIALAFGNDRECGPIKRPVLINALTAQGDWRGGQLTVSGLGLTGS